MKKWLKIILIIGIASLLLGSVISIGVLIAGGGDWDKFTVDVQNLSCFEQDITARDIDTVLIGDNSEDFDITLTPSPDKDFHLTYYGKNEDEVLAEADNGRLTVSFPQNTANGGVLNLAYTDREITLAIPATVENIEVRNGYGNLYAAKLKLKGDFALYADGGYVELTEITASRVITEIVYGELRLKQLSCTELTGKCEATALKMKDITASALSLKCSDGEINAKGITAEEARWKWENMNGTVSDAAFQTFTLDNDEGYATFQGLTIKDTFTLNVDETYINLDFNCNREDLSVITSCYESDCNLQPIIGEKGKIKVNITADESEINATFSNAQPSAADI